MDIVQALETLVPGAKYGGYPRDREHYENLRWEDERPQPSWEQIEGATVSEVEAWRNTATVTRRQGRLALLGAGMLDAVETALASIEDPIQKLAAAIEYEADTWARNNAFLQGMWSQLGGTPEQLDDLFKHAGTL